LDLMHKEKKALWKVKALLTELCGDHTWAPGGMFTNSTDGDLFPEDLGMRMRELALPPLALENTPSSTPTVNGEPIRKSVGLLQNGGGAPSLDVDGTDRRDHSTLHPSAGEARVNGAGSSRRSNHEADHEDESENNRIALLKKSLATARDAAQPVSASRADSTRLQNGVKAAAPPEESRAEGGGGGGGGRGSSKTDQALVPAGSPTDQKADISMTDSAIDMSRPRSATSNPADDPFSELFIHPFFLAPGSALPDRNLGLPEQEAEDVRRLVQLYVQKQEEVCRGTTRLYEGLLKADRLRKTVLKWSKAEAHVGALRDMSDGEDWYDKEEWGLTEDLKKGQDEEEEDTAAQTQKKTRNRR
jgi:hypothetical protein